jgi:hypothetical protein
MDPIHVMYLIHMQSSLYQTSPMYRDMQLVVETMKGHPSYPSEFGDETRYRRMK